MNIVDISEFSSMFWEYLLTISPNINMFLYAEDAWGAFLHFLEGDKENGLLLGLHEMSCSFKDIIFLNLRYLTKERIKALQMQSSNL